jgi:hypothetical protein
VGRPAVPHHTNTRTHQDQDTPDQFEDNSESHEHEKRCWKLEKRRFQEIYDRLVAL